MEYVIVNFASSRSVFVDGKQSGATNTIFRVGPGIHEFDLGMPLDYYPRQKRVTIQGTNALAPAVIHFDQLNPS
ncbi:MAG: hypothetical protein L0Y43_07470 [Methylococcaceae bacterium]|nr:hypothetical protein [Methylococcaceae bacterium]